MRAFVYKLQFAFSLLPALIKCADVTGLPAIISIYKSDERFPSDGRHVDHGAMRMV